MLNKDDAIIVGFVILFIAEIFMTIRKIPIKRNAIILISSIYFIFFISIVFFPIPYQLKGYDCEYNFIPFYSISKYLVDRETNSMVAILGNIILTIPWGILFEMLFNTSKKHIFWISTTAFLICIEITQHIINELIGYKYRCVDIDDFILNFTGALLGYILYILFFKKIYRNIFLDDAKNDK